MFLSNYYISIYIVLVTCLMFGFYYKHLILTVISLEFIAISVVYNMFLIMMNLGFISYLVVFFLVFSVCEGGLVLSLVVMMVRLHGNDYLNSLSAMKW